MDLNEVYNRLNFLINKAQGAWFAPPDLDRIVDQAQNSLFDSYYIKYSTSQRLEDALSPFKKDYQFTLLTSPGGLINTPSDYYDLLSIYTLVTGSDNVTRYRAVEVVNEDELAIRLNSQITPVSVDYPIAIIKTDWDVQLYPAQAQAGVMTYLKKPTAPYFAYSLVSGRVIVYDQVNSVQLEWADKDIKSILLIALNDLGINMSEQDLMQWSEMKSQQNLTTIMKQ